MQLSSPADEPSSQRDHVQPPSIFDHRPIVEFGSRIRKKPIEVRTSAPPRALPGGTPVPSTCPGTRVWKTETLVASEARIARLSSRFARFGAPSPPKPHGCPRPLGFQEPDRSSGLPGLPLNW